MRLPRTLGVILVSIIPTLSISQNAKPNSDTRKFIDNATFTQVNRDWNVTADFRSGIGEIVSFFPVEAIDLKSNEKVRSLQMDMTIQSGAGNNYFKSSWIDLSEVDEFIYFIEQFVVPNLKDKADKKQSVTYIFNSKEITFKFYIGRNARRISIYLKDSGIMDSEHYFWTESQVSKIPDLLAVLKQIR